MQKGGTNFLSLGWGKKRGEPEFSKILGGNQSLTHVATHNYADDNVLSAVAANVTGVIKSLKVEPMKPLHGLITTLSLQIWINFKQ